jgi:hypothetical protein
MNDVFCSCPYPSWYLHKHGLEVCRGCGRIKSNEDKMAVINFLLNESREAGERATEAMKEVDRKIEELRIATQRFKEAMESWT